MTSLPPKRMKKLIVCCDGTWMNSGQGVSNGDSLTDTQDPVLQFPTNVTRICRAVKVKDSNQNEQITFYQSGVGTRDLLDKAVGGMTGAGLGENIREAYQFLAANYDQDAGDEIYLVGFSRGSFTARSIAAFISEIGLLTAAGMVYLYPIFQDWENQLMLKTDWKQNPHFPWREPRPSAKEKDYINGLFDRGYTRKDVKVNAVACFDTVGALGIPRFGMLKDFFEPKSRAQHSIDYSFIDTTVPAMVEHAIHALALDEMREAFAPTMWELPKAQPGQTLTQCWFPGAHADVGGFSDDCRSADISLAWMINQLKEYITFDYKILTNQMYNYHTTNDKRPWSCGDLHDPIRGSLVALAERLFGRENRAPLEYNKYNWKTGKEFIDPKIPLTETGETIHSSVRVRMGVHGKGWCLDNDEYKPKALEGWTLPHTAAEPLKGPVTLEQIQDGQKDIKWWKKGTDGKTLYLREAILSQIEFDLLNSVEPNIVAKFLSTGPK